MKKILYLGTDPSHFKGQNVLHYPVIKIVPRTIDISDLSLYTHIIFTSKNAVKVFFSQVSSLPPSLKVIAIGKVTAEHIQADMIAQEETQEGIINLLKHIDLKNAYIFYPRSSLSRPVLLDFLKSQNIRHAVCDLYDTLPQQPLPLPNFNEIDEIIFTSPSTVDAFLLIFGSLPLDKKLTSIGPITEERLREELKRCK